MISEDGEPSEGLGTSGIYYRGRRTIYRIDLIMNLTLGFVIECVLMYLPLYLFIQSTFGKVTSDTFNT
jgi:hypothetical protein